MQLEIEFVKLCPIDLTLSPDSDFGKEELPVTMLFQLLHETYSCVIQPEIIQIYRSLGHNTCIDCP